MNGPTEREQRWATALDFSGLLGELTQDNIIRDAMAEADRESATLRARVAVLERELDIAERTSQRNADAHMAEFKRRRVLEQQTAAIEARRAEIEKFCRDLADTPSYQVNAEYHMVVKAVFSAVTTGPLAAGAVDNPTERPLREDDRPADEVRP